MAKKRLNVTVSGEVHSRLTVLAHRCGFRGVPAMVTALLRLAVEPYMGAEGTRRQTGDSGRETEAELEVAGEDSVAAMFSALAEAERSRVEAGYRLRRRM